MEMATLVIYDIEDDRSRTRVSEACKDFGLERVQYSCFKGMLSRTKRGELYERFRVIQTLWAARWRKDFPDSDLEMSDSPDTPDRAPATRWQPAFKIIMQPICEKDAGSATYAYLFVDVGESAND
jgi:hypothetical protein